MNHLALLRRTLSVTCYAALPVLLLLISFFAPSFGFFISAGQAAEWGLVVILFASPLNVVWPNWPARHILVFRRQLGVAIVWLALVHGGGLMWEYGLFKASYFLGLDNYYFYGALGLIALLVLGLTSNNIAVRMLKRNWKRVQYLSYVALFLVLVHVGMAHHHNSGSAIMIGTLFIALKILQHSRVNLRKIVTQ